MNCFFCIFSCKIGGALERVCASRKTLMIKGNIPLCIAILCLIILGGCAKKETVRNLTDEEVLQERVTEYWNLTTKEDYIKSYEYEDPLFRKAVGMNQYIKSHSDMYKIKEMKINSVTIEDNSGVVYLTTKVELHVPGVKPLVADTERKDRWGKINGIWYHVNDKYSGKQGAKSN